MTLTMIEFNLNIRAETTKMKCCILQRSEKSLSQFDMCVSVCVCVHNKYILGCNENTVTELQLRGPSLDILLWLPKPTKDMEVSLLMFSLIHPQQYNTTT